MTPHWFVVVESDKRDVYEELRRRFDGAPLAAVILDRRRAERRRQNASGSADRRHTDRRRAGAAYRLIGQADGFRVYQGEGWHPVQCRHCGEALEFEMPRFREPPARLEIEVTHPPRDGPHRVVIQAFTVSGRPLLAGQIVPRRRRRAATP